MTMLVFVMINDQKLAFHFDPTWILEQFSRTVHFDPTWILKLYFCMVSQMERRCRRPSKRCFNFDS
ncbi:Unconventional myosin-Vb [Frankliniella fusca]|uniref:Unconventional myosin-Vb n=1 Tax=Frankliniella fusca TaxID=407009 RepID=A0AAE1LJ88_9NEOP|nr:Unconventional myosin-Vb [Frankliniella fusca]